MTSATISAAPPPAPRYEIAWALLIYVGCVLLLGYPALTGGFLVTPPSDQYIGGFPVRDFAAQSLKAGEGFPLWNPFIYGGMPYVAAMGVGDIFYPTFLLRAALPVDVAMTLAFMIHIVLAALFTYVFCRSVGLSFGASLIGGAAYAMSGPIAGLVSPGHDGKLYVSALLPLVLYLLTRYMRRGDLWALGGLAIAIGLAVLSPHPQLLQYLLLTAGFYGMFLAFGEWNGERLAPRMGAQRLGFALGAVALGFLMGAIQYAPFLEYIPWSPRAGGKGWEHAVSFSMPPEELFISTYLPEFSGILGRYWGRNGIHHHSEYVGPVVLILATAAIGAGGKAVAFSRKFKLFWLGVLIISALWALGGFTPFYRIVYAIVPGTKYFRAPSTIMYISMFATALFAAIGAERVLSSKGVAKRFLTTWGIVAGVIAVLALSGGFTNLGMAIVGTATMGGQPMSERVADNAGAVAIGGIRSLVFALVTLGVLWGIATRRLVARGAIAALLVVVALDLWSVERKYWQFSESAASLYASDPIIDLLKTQRDSARVFAIALPGAYVAYHDPMIQGDGLMIHGVRQVRGYHGNQLGRYDRLIGEESGLEPVVASPQIWSLLNMRYVLTNVPPTAPIVQELYGANSLVAGPVRNVAGTMVYLYKVPGENPPAWVASGVMKAPEEATLATLHDPRFNAEMQRRVALIDTSSTLPVITDPTTVPPPSTIAVTVRRPGNGRIVVDLSAPAQNGNMLIVSENFYPGWRARVNGTDAVVERADYVLIGVPLSAGARQVELLYTSNRYEIGKLVTLAATGVALVLAIVGWFVDRRRALPVPARLATEVS